MKPYLLILPLTVFAATQVNASPTMNLNRPYHDSLAFSEFPPNPVVFYSPGQRDFLFEKAETVELGILSQKRAISATWSLAKNMGKEVLASGEALREPDGGFTMSIPSAELEPGFYDVEVEISFGPKEEKYLSVFGYRIDEIKPAFSPPADFVEFWQGVRKEVASVPLDAETGPWQTFDEKALEDYLTGHAFLPKRFDPEGVRFDKIDVQTVAFSGLNGSRITAHVAKPQVQGRLPAILILPGAGGWNAVRPYPLEHARHGYLTMDVAIHGTGASSTATDDPKRTHDAFQMYANALQALNYLRSREDVDPDRIAVAGMSQGGRLAFVLAGLDDKLCAVIPSITHHADLEYERRLNGQPAAATTGIEKYFDVVSFAGQVRAPVFMNAGLVDRVSPAARVHQAYLAIPHANKTFLPMPGISHFVTFESDRRAWRWLEKLNPPATGKIDTAK